MQGVCVLPKPTTDVRENGKRACPCLGFTTRKKKVQERMHHEDGVGWNDVSDANQPWRQERDGWEIETHDVASTASNDGT